MSNPENPNSKSQELHETREENKMDGGEDRENEEILANLVNTNDSRMMNLKDVYEIYSRLIKRTTLDDVINYLSRRLKPSHKSYRDSKGYYVFPKSDFERFYYLFGEDGPFIEEIKTILESIKLDELTSFKKKVVSKYKEIEGGAPFDLDNFMRRAIFFSDYNAEDETWCRFLAKNNLHGYFLKELSLKEKISEIINHLFKIWSIRRAIEHEQKNIEKYSELRKKAENDLFYTFKDYFYSEFEFDLINNTEIFVLRETIKQYFDDDDNRVLFHYDDYYLENFDVDNHNEYLKIIIENNLLPIFFLKLFKIPVSKFVNMTIEEKKQVIEDWRATDYC